MRSSYVFLSLLIASIAFAAVPALADYNLLQNPGFETGVLDPWEGGSGGAGGFGIVSPGHTGTYCAGMGGGDGGAGIWQDINPPRCAIFLEFWYKGSNGGVEITYSDGTLQGESLPDTDTWTKIHIELDTTKLVERVVVGSGDGGIYVDDFDLEACAIPVVGGELAPAPLINPVMVAAITVSASMMMLGYRFTKK